MESGNVANRFSINTALQRGAIAKKNAKTVSTVVRFEREAVETARAQLSWLHPAEAGC